MYLSIHSFNSGDLVKFGIISCHFYLDFLVIITSCVRTLILNLVSPPKKFTSKRSQQSPDYQCCFVYGFEIKKFSSLINDTRVINDKYANQRVGRLLFGPLFLYQYWDHLGALGLLIKYLNATSSEKAVCICIQTLPSPAPLL